MRNAKLNRVLAITVLIVKWGIISFLMVAAMEVLDLWPGVRPAY